MLKSAVANFLVIAVMFSALTLPVWAKRAAPPVVKPVVVGGIKYIAPNDQGTLGHIQAIKVKTGKKLWDQAIYRVKLQPNLEADVQWVFIKSMQVKGDRLLVVNEKDQKFTFPLR
jgi:hypothetical protein